MQDLSAKPKYMPSGALRNGSGWDASLSNSTFPTLKKNDYRGPGFDYGDRIPKAPSIGKPEIAVTAERLHNAQISEGLSGGPNRLTLGQSYKPDADGLGDIWSTLFSGAKQNAARTLPVAGAAIAISAASAFGESLFSRYAPGIKSSALNMFPWLGSAATKFQKTQEVIAQTQPLPMRADQSPTGPQTPTRVAPAVTYQPAQPQPQLQITYAGGGGYGAYSGGSSAPAAPGFFDSIPTWVYPVGAGLVLLAFAMKKGGAISHLIPLSVPHRRRRR